MKIPQEFWPVVAQQMLVQLEKEWQAHPTFILMTWREHYGRPSS